MTVYDLDGNAHEMADIDARECVAVMGWQTTAAVVDEVEEITKGKNK